MTTDNQSRRRFIKDAGLATGAVMGASILPSESAAAQGGAATAATGRTSAQSKGARLRAAIASGEPLVLPVVESVLLARLAEIEGFTGGFLGGSGNAARAALPNTSIQTIREVIDYEVEIMSNTDLPFVVDGENGGGSPMVTYRTTQQLERGGAACIMIEDTIGPESDYGGKGAPLAPIPVMVGRIKAALDARADQTMMIMARIHRPAKGYSEQETMELAGQLSAAGCDAFYLTGFSLDQQQKAKATLKKPLMVGSGGPATEWHSKGVDMAYYHVDPIGVGAMYMALKELKATGKFTEAAKMALPRDISSRALRQQDWLARAKKYGVIA
jgi:2-methylisocitrate lyase-like PEP mutase family enzyme